MLDYTTFESERPADLLRLMWEWAEFTKVRILDVIVQHEDDGYWIGKVYYER